MRLVMTRRAEINLANQYDYGVRTFGATTANRTLERLNTYLSKTLLCHPRTNTYHPEYDVYETWIPRTPFVIFYRIDVQVDELVVLALFHYAQDRTQFFQDRD